MLLQVRRARAHHAPVGRDLARGERRVLELGDAHREVEAFLDDIHIAVGQAEREAHVGIARDELRHQRRDMLVAEGGGQRHLEVALRIGAARRHGRVGLLDLGKQACAGLVVARALVGEVQPARGAVDQAHPEPRLQARQAPADQRHRQTQFARRRRQTAGTHYLGEHRHFVQRVSHGGLLQTLQKCFTKTVYSTRTCKAL
jgi:hypothetical protein